MGKTQTRHSDQNASPFESKVMVIPVQDDFFENVHLKKSAENKNYPSCKELQHFIIAYLFTMSIKKTLKQIYCLNTLTPWHVEVLYSPIYYHAGLQ